MKISTTTTCQHCNRVIVGAYACDQCVTNRVPANHELYCLPCLLKHRREKHWRTIVHGQLTITPELAKEVMQSDNTLSLFDTGDHRFVGRAGKSDNSRAAWNAEVWAVIYPDPKYMDWGKMENVKGTGKNDRTTHI